MYKTEFISGTDRETAQENAVQFIKEQAEKKVHITPDMVVSFEKVKPSDDDYNTKNKNKFRLVWNDYQPDNE